MSIVRAAEWIKREKFIAIIRGKYTQDEINTIAETLVNASIVSLEITLNTTAALLLIESLRKHFGDDMLIGAGTVRTAEQLQQAADAGAQFIVSPNFDPSSATLVGQVERSLV